MTKERIYELVETAKEELNQEFRKDDYGYYFVKNFLDTNQLSKATDLIDIDIKKLIKCYYFVSTDYSLKESIKRMDYVLDLFKHKIGNEYIVFTDLATEFVNSNTLPLVISYLKEKKKNESKRVIEAISEKNDPTVVTQLKLLKTFTKDSSVQFFEMVNEDYYTMSRVISLFFLYHRMCLENENMRQAISDIESLFNRTISEKSKNKNLSRYVKGYLDTKELMKDINIIKTYISEVDKEERKFYKNQEKIKNSLDTTMKQLERALLQEEITNAREIVKSVQSDEIKNAILLLIYEHNMPYYKGLEEKYQKLKENSKREYLALLQEFNINVEKDLESIMQNSVKDVKTMLNLLKSLNLSNDKIILILENSNIHCIECIIKLKNTGFLNEAFLRENCGVFFRNSPKRDRIEKNIDTLSSFNLSPSLFKNYIEFVLLIDESLLRKNIQILEEYDLMNFKNTFNFSFLQEEDFRPKLDRIIELGYEKQLEENLEILSISTSKYLEVLKALNIPNEIDLNLGEILANFFIEDDKLDEYIPSILPYKEKIDLGKDEKKLQEFKNSRRTYKIGNILISSLKVSRLLIRGYDLYDSIFYNVNLSEDEYNEVIAELTNKEFKK